MSAADRYDRVRTLIADEIARWDTRNPGSFTYAEGLRDGLKAALQYMDAVDRPAQTTSSADAAACEDAEVDAELTERVRAALHAKSLPHAAALLRDLRDDLTAGQCIRFVKRLAALEKAGAR